MYYNYKCKDKTISVFVSSNELCDCVTVTSNKKSYDRTIREDKFGKFFTWDREKIYLDDWLRSSIKELKWKIENNIRVTSDDLCQAIMSDGIENVRFMVPLNTTCGFGFFLDGNKFKETLCMIRESWNREVKQNYKITLVPVNPDDSVASRVDYYTMDFLSLIESGNIAIVEGRIQ